MNLLDYLLKEADFQERKISDLSDTPSSDGMSAMQLKAYFDYIPKTLIAMGALNGVINLLASSEGAANIGAGVTGLTGTTVQEILETAKFLIEDRYTKKAVDGLLDDKAEKNTVETMIKSVSFDASTGVFTFTEEGGTVHKIDTLLEKIAVNFEYDPEIQALILKLADGTTQRISLSEFVTANEVQGSDSIQVSTSGGVATISIRNGSITDSMFSSSLLATIREYANFAEVSAQNASASEVNARTYANNAAASENGAKTHEANAGEYANSASTYANTAAIKAAEASSSADAALEAQKAAEKARDEAGQAASGGVSDVKIENASIVENGVAHIPVITAASGGLGLFRVGNVANGLIGVRNNNGVVVLVYPEVSSAGLTGRKTQGSQGSGVVCSSNFDLAVKIAMADGNGASWTEDEQAAARARMGAASSEEIKIKSVSVNGVPQAIDTNKNVDIEVPDPDLSKYAKTSEVESALEDKAPAYTYGTTDLTPGTSPLATGKLHFVYE